MGKMESVAPSPATAPASEASAPGAHGAALSQIVLHPARCPAFPEGSTRTGYVFVAPLDDEGHLDASLWSEQRDHCVVRRFHDGETDRIGHLAHRPGGSGGATWSFLYADGKPNDEEPGHHLQDHRFIPGEYVSIREDDGEVRTFSVAEVRPLRSR